MRLSTAASTAARLALAIALEQRAQRREVRTNAVLGRLALAPAERRDRLALATERGQRESLHVPDVTERFGERSFVLAQHPPGVMDARRHGRIELARPPVRGHRRVEQSAVAQRVDEPGVQLRVGRLFRGALEQQPHGLVGPAEIDHELRVKAVRDGEVRIQRERALECFLGTRQMTAASSQRRGELPDQAFARASRAQAGA